MLRKSASREGHTSEVEILQVVMHRQVLNFTDQIERHLDDFQILRRSEVEQTTDTVVRGVKLEQR